MRHRSESKAYRQLAAFFRDAYPQVGSHGAAAMARIAERDLVFTDASGRLYFRVPGREPIEVPNVDP